MPYVYQIVTSASQDRLENGVVDELRRLGTFSEGVSFEELPLSPPGADAAFRIVCSA